MTVITFDSLKAISPNGNVKIMAGLAQCFEAVFKEYGIDTNLRKVHFLGQGASETDGFRTLEEYASGKAYEGRKDLGNTKKGDGVKFKGRGVFQTTGRFNYDQLGHFLQINLIDNPELLSHPEYAAESAGHFWQTRHLNTWADADDIRGVTKHINGGLNGLSDRIIYTNRAKKLFGLK